MDDVRVLDQGLAPLRRVVEWSVESLDARAERARYVEAICRPALAPVVRLDLPEPVRDAVARIDGLLDGFDGTVDGDRVARLRALYDEIVRLDATLGLPLGPRSTDEGALPPAEPLEPSTDEGEPRVLVPDEPSDEDDVVRADNALARPLASLDIDAATLEALEKEELETVGDLLQLVPIGSETVRVEPDPPRASPAGIAVSGRLRSRATLLHPDGSRELLLRIGGSSVVSARMAGWKWVAPWMVPGQTITLAGTLATDGVLREAEPAVAHAGEVSLARYGLDAVADPVVRSLVWRVLSEAPAFRDPLPPGLVSRAGLLSFGDALAAVHTGADAAAPRRRLAFDEALLVHLGFGAPRALATRERGIAHPIAHGQAARLAQTAEFEPDDAQQEVFDEILRDLRRSTPMQRVLTGEPGAGKWMIALLAAAVVTEGRAQVMILVPDAVSADLRYLFADPWLRELGLVGRLVLGEPSKAQRDAIRRGEVHVVFGTLDLFERDLEFRRLGLVIADEGDAWGRTAARAAAWKPPRPDLLVLSVAPVPSSMLVTAYADHDLSVLAPPPRTFRVAVHAESSRGDAYRRAAEIVRAGGQAIVTFPHTTPERDPERAEIGADLLDLRSARQVIEGLSGDVFSGLRIGLFHGSLAREERWRTWDDFLRRRTDVLVATVPFVDGPRAVRASVVIVEHADDLPLAQLLRIRGHLGATERTPGIEAPELHFVLGEEDADGSVAARLERLSGRSSAEIVETEFAARSAPTLSERVNPASRFRWFDPIAHHDLALIARAHAHDLLATDPGLRKGATADVGRLLRDRWEEWFSGPCPLPDAGAGASGGGRRRRRRKRRRGGGA